MLLNLNELLILRIHLQTTVAKKIMFYKMKLKTAERGYNEVVKKLEAAKEKLNVFSLNMSRKLLFSIKQVWRQPNFCYYLMIFVEVLREND